MSAANPAPFVIGIVTLFMAAVTCAQAQEPAVISECGQHVASGRLAADLDCSASGGHAIVIGGGVLDLAGFTVTGDAGGAYDAVRCTPECVVVGPGEIVGGVHGIHATFERPDPEARYRVDVRDVRISGAADDAVAVFRGRATVRGAVLEDNGGCAVAADSVKAIDSTIRNNACGIVARRASVAGSEVESNRAGTWTGWPYAIGVSAERIRARASTFSGHLAGADANALPGCEVWGCGDIRTFGRRPKLKEVSCEISLDVVPFVDSNTTQTLTTWGLCSDDADFDRDGTNNESDACHSHPGCSAGDADGDGRGDCCDNCPNVSNFFQGDDDVDGTGNACE